MHKQMKRTLILSLLILSIGLAFAQRPNTAVIPAHRLDRKSWSERHEQILEKVKSSDPKLILIGNSITHNLDLPETGIVLLGILPYGYKPNHRDETNKATNAIIARFPEKDSKIHYYDLGYLFLNENGTVKGKLMPDYLHPTAEGGKLVFEALAPVISKWLKD